MSKYGAVSWIATMLMCVWPALVVGDIVRFMIYGIAIYVVAMNMFTGVYAEQVSQIIPWGGIRSHVAIPAQGMIEFRDALTDLLDEFGIDDQGQYVRYRLLVSCYFHCLQCTVDDVTLHVVQVAVLSVILHGWFTLLVWCMRVTLDCAPHVDLCAYMCVFSCHTIELVRQSVGCL